MGRPVGFCVSMRNKGLMRRRIGDSRGLSDATVLAKIGARGSGPKMGRAYGDTRGACATLTTQTGTRQVPLSIVNSSWTGSNGFMRSIKTNQTFIRQLVRTVKHGYSERSRDGGLAWRSVPTSRGVPPWPAFTNLESKVRYLGDPITVGGVASIHGLSAFDAVYSTVRGKPFAAR